jgi:peptidyl-prolyl cis-trans isomerase SurA
MHWRGPLASAVIGFGLMAVGCECEEDFVCRSYPSLLHAIGVAGQGDEAAARAQAPDNDKSIVQVAQVTAKPPTAEPIVGITAARVCATVNGEAILEEEVKAMSMPMMRNLDHLPEAERSKRQAEALKQSLDLLIEREVVVQDLMSHLNAKGNEKNLEKIKEMTEKEFEKSWLRPVKEQFKIKSDEELKEFLKKQGVSFTMQKRLWERNYMAQQYLQQRAFPIVDSKLGHLQIVEYYDKHPEQFKIEDEVQWQELFIAAAKYATREAARHFAEQLAQRVRQGEDFVKLSEQFDDGDSRYRKSDGIGRKHGEIKPPEVEPTVFSLKDGELALMEQASGFRVVRVVKRQYAGLMPFDDKTQKLIKDRIRGEIMERETKRVIADLKREAVIDIYK